MYTIYSLIDPRDNTTRYVGMTQDIYERTRQHSNPFLGGNAAKSLWIQELQNEQLVFIVKSLETVPTLEQAQEREAFWIRSHLDSGSPLLNILVASSYKPKTPIQPFDIEQLNEKTPSWIVGYLLIPSKDGNAIKIAEASDHDFENWISSQGVPLASDEAVQEWSFDDRLDVISHALMSGIKLTFAQEGDKNEET